MNWRQIARKPFHALGIETPGETARLLLRQNILGKPYWWTEFPLAWQIDTNNHCGPKYCGVFCEYCYPQWRILNGKDCYAEMPMEQLEWIIRNIGKHGSEMRECWRAKNGFGFIAYFLNGDGLTEPRLPEILRLSKKLAHGIGTQTFTCGVLTENAGLLCDRNLDWVCVTLSAPNREIYKRVHRGDKFDAVLKTMRYITENRKPNQRLEVHYVITQNNFPYMQNWQELMKREFPEWHRVFSPLVKSFDNEPSVKAMGNLTLEQQEEAIRKVAPEGGFWCHETTNLRRACVLFHNASVTADGTLLQCCNWADPQIWNYGNVADYIRRGYDLRDYWLMRLANGLNNPLCENCNLKRADWRERVGNIKVKVHVKP